jgi:hypothetical protein
LPDEKPNEVKLNSVKLIQQGNVTTAINCREPFTVDMDYEIRQPVRGSRFFLIVRNGKGELIFTTSDYDQMTREAVERSAGSFTSTVEIPSGLLKTGSYYGSFGVDVANVRIIYTANDVFHFDVFEPEDDTQSERHKRPGAIAPLLSWKITPNDHQSDSSHKER